MKQRVLTFLFAFLTTVGFLPIQLLHAQNGLIGDGFGSNDWSTIDIFSGSAGNSRIGTFTANGTGDRYFRLVTNWGGNNNQWGPSSTTNDYEVTIGSEVPSSEIIENSTTKAYYINAPNTSDFYVFKTQEGDNPPSSKGLIVYRVQGTIQGINAVSTPSGPKYPGETYTVTATLSGSLSTGQSLFLRYSTDNWTTSSVLSMSGSGTIYSATIPASAHKAGATIRYYVLSSGSGVTPNHTNADWYTINLNNNGGSNYSYTVNSSCVTAQNGNWSSSSTWLGNAVPSAGEPVTIDHDVTLDLDATVSSLVINSGNSFTASDGNARTLTISTDAAATTLTCNGTWANGTGGSTVTFAGTGSHTISGTIGFNDVDISRPVDFGLNVTINGTLRILANGYVNVNAPTYTVGSTLQYSSGGTYNRDVEWSQLSGSAYPWHVRVSNSTYLNLNNYGKNQHRAIRGDLTVDASSTVDIQDLSIGATDIGITIEGDVINNGTITFSTSTERLKSSGYSNNAGAATTLSSNFGGDLEVTGDFSNEGTFNPSGRALFFTGSSGDQAISGSGGVTLDYMILDKAAGQATLSNDLNINNTLTLTAGLLTTGVNRVFIAATGSIATASSASYVNGRLSIEYTTTGSKTFPIGKGGAYRPLTFNYSALTGTSTVTAEQFESDLPGSLPSNINLAQSRFWTLSHTAGGAFSYIVTLDGGASLPGDIVMLKGDGTVNTAYGTTGGPQYFTNAATFSTIGTPEYFALGKNCIVEVFVGGTSAACYGTLKAAFDAINAGTHAGVLTVKIHESTTETASAVLNASGSGSASYSSILVYPTASGLSVTGDIGGPLIDLNGADNVTIDGRVNAAWSDKDLTVSNTNTGTSAATIRFINDARDNKIQYCKIKGVSQNQSGGVICFATAHSSGLLGNNDNTITQNDISGDGLIRPVHVIFSQGTIGAENSNDSVVDNNIFDFLDPASTSGGIFLFSGTSNWVITGNSFYEPSALNPVANGEYFAIKVLNSGSDYYVSGNYIGGAASGCGGIRFTKSGNGDNLFRAIYFEATSGIIRANTIANIDWINNGAAYWTGIHIEEGQVSVGGTSINDGNIIGDSTGSNSITYIAGDQFARFTGIYRNASNLGNNIDISYNNVSGISAGNSNNQNSTSFYGILNFEGNNDIITNNTIGHRSTIRSIDVWSESQSNSQNVYGINSEGGVAEIASNFIGNLFNGAKSNTSTNNGIYAVDCNYEIHHNTITKLEMVGSNNTGADASIVGINIPFVNIPGVSNNIYSNTITNLTNAHVTEATTVIGIYYGSSRTGLVERNFIHTLSNQSSNSDAKTIGIYLNHGNPANGFRTTFQNNVISLSTPDPSSILHGFFIVDGIYSLYHNTISLNGSRSNLDAALTVSGINHGEIVNNIFANRCSGSGTHRAVYMPDMANTGIVDYNDYLGDLFIQPMGPGSNYVTNDPQFFNASGTSLTDYEVFATNLVGDVALLTTIPDDIDEIAIRCVPTMGAQELPIPPDSLSATATPDTLCVTGTLVLTGYAVGATTWHWSGPNGFYSTDLVNTIPDIELADSGLYWFSASNNCGDADSVSVQVVVIDTVRLTASITASANPVCAGDPVTFTAVTNGGALATFQWYVGSSQIPGATSDTYTYNPGNNDQVYCLVSSMGCVTGSPVFSDTITITHSPENTITLTSSARNVSVCVNNFLPPITFVTTGATGVTITGLPNGVNGVWNSGNLSISGTPTVVGDSLYIIRLNGGCGQVADSGIISVTDSATLTLTSDSATIDQNICLGAPIVPITYITTGPYQQPPHLSPHPAWININVTGNLITISGTPIAIEPPTTYSLQLDGCETPTEFFTITIHPKPNTGLIWHD